MHKLDDWLTALFPAGALAFFATAARSLLLERHHGWVGFFTNSIAAVVASFLAWHASEAMAWGENYKVIMVGLSSFLAPDLLLWVRATFAAAAPDLTQRVQDTIHKDKQ